jgi:hypothetical protein
MLKSILGVPEAYRIVALTPLGYGNETPDPRIEKTIKDIAFYNKWGTEMVFK